MSVQHAHTAEASESLHNLREAYRKQVVAMLQNMATRDKLHDTEVRDAVQAAEEFGVDVAFFLINHHFFVGITSICTLTQVSEVVTGMRQQGSAIHAKPRVRMFCAALIEGIELHGDNYWLRVK